MSKDRAGDETNVPGEPQSKECSLGEVQALVASLSGDDATERSKARKSLAECGQPAVAPLTEALGSPKPQVRWEAAKTLAEIGDASAAPALVEALGDSDSGVRWVAGDALIRIERPALVPLLQALISHTATLRDGAYHVLHHLAHCGESYSQILLPVVEALRSLDAAVATPVAAEEALQRLGEANRAEERGS